LAGASAPGGGLQVGDVVVGVNGTPVRLRADLDDFLKTTRPGDEIRLTIRRGTASESGDLEFTVKLDERPLELIRPEADPGTRPVPSFLTGIHSIGNDEAGYDELELPSVRSLRTGHWKMEEEEDGVVFRKLVSLGEGDDAGQLEFVKRYQLKPIPADQLDNHDYPGYHLVMNVEVWNRTAAEQEVAYRIDGPNGLPLEGWWYSYKTSPQWGGAGARDIIWRGKDDKEKLRGPTQIDKELDKQPEPLLDQASRGGSELDYLGVDTQYFSAVMLAGVAQKPAHLVCQQAFSVPLGNAEELEGKKVRTMNVTFRMISQRAKINPGESLSHQYHLFLGPKSTNLLQQYGISDIIEYGWFGFVARPLSRLLHFFYRIIRNYGLAIILLTVLVRGLMFPVGRKAARNAQMMQELAPEIKKIKEKYKNDMEKQAQAQRELWKKHNFNPLGGCWLMFLQLPIFIGLYRCLSVDIELRQAPLIPGIQWCSNLAAPDMFLNWETPSLQFLTGTAGWLGPYLNLLPIATIALFMLQQKMFTPPATDEQTMMQQRMMKYMMVLMGFLFFKVPSGLCIYFIASSIWGIADRKLLPKPDLKKNTEAAATSDRAKSKAGPAEPDARGKRKRRR
jgi:YidC/Oxa1 family membrane protein insertase